MSEVFLLTEAQTARLAPLLPNDTRGVPRVDDRRVISGIVHVLRSGADGRMHQLPTDRTKRLQPLCPLGGQGRLAEHVSCARRRGRTAHRIAARQFHDEGSSLRRRWKRGQRAQAIGVSRGGRTSKLLALSDQQGRPRAFVLTGGQAADCRAAEALLRLLPEGVLVIADRAHDTDAVRAAKNGRCATPNIPPSATGASKRLSAGCCTVAASRSSACSDD